MKQVLIETALFKPQQLSFTEGLKSKRGFPICLLYTSDAADE